MQTPNEEQRATIEGLRSAIGVEIKRTGIHSYTQLPVAIPPDKSGYGEPEIAPSDLIRDLEAALDALKKLPSHGTKNL